MVNEYSTGCPRKAISIDLVAVAEDGRVPEGSEVSFGGQARVSPGIDAGRFVGYTL